MPIQNDAQDLANKYAGAIKRIRIIRKAGDDFIITPATGQQGEPVRLGPASSYRQDFERFTARYPEIREVRVIPKAGAGPSQFFPADTPDEYIWNSTVSKEELEA